MSNRKRPSRRQFLRGALVGAGAVAVPTLLTACGTPASESAATTNASPAASAAPSVAGTASEGAATSTAANASAIEGTIRWWDLWVTQEPWITKEIELFQQAYPKIKVERNFQAAAEFTTLFQAAMAEPDTAPDIYIINGNLEDYANNDWAADLAQFPDFSAYQSTFPNPTVDFVEGINIIDGKVLSSPREAIWSGMWVFMYANTKLLQDAGITTVPETLDDMLVAARALKEKGVAAFCLPATQWNVGMPTTSAYFSGLAAFDKGINFKTGRVETSTNPGIKKVLQTLATMRDEGLLAPESASVDDEAMRAAFAEGKFAMFIDGSWAISGWKQTHPTFTDYTVTHVPYPEAGPPAYWQVGPGGKSFAINPASKNQAAAWEFYKWLTSREASKRWVQGGHGTSRWQEDNNPEFVESSGERDIFKVGPENTRLAPQFRLKNPALNKLKWEDPKPSLNELVVGVYNGSISDIDAALAEYDKQANANLDAALQELTATGVQASREDFAFPDWDPTKDYIQSSTSS